MSEIKKRAAGKWPGILMQLGVDESYLSGKHGPCPICQAGKDRFRFTDFNHEGMYICNQCGSGSGFDLLMNVNGWDFATAAKEIERIVGSVKEPKQKQKRDPAVRLRAIQETARSPGEAVIDYLKGRGLAVIPPGIYQGRDRYFEDGRLQGEYDVMLGKVVSPHGNPLTWHVTYIQDGQKAPLGHPKKIMKATGNINGGAIRLWPVARHIGIAEGIESAIAAHELYGIPVWAVMNATCMERFVVPDGVESLSIFADNDRTFTGQKAAYGLANRLVISGSCLVDVRVPAQVGTDFMDELNKLRKAG